MLISEATGLVSFRASLAASVDSGMIMGGAVASVAEVCAVRATGKARSSAAIAKPALHRWTLGVGEEQWVGMGQR